MGSDPLKDEGSVVWVFECVEACLRLLIELGGGFVVFDDGWKEQMQLVRRLKSGDRKQSWFEWWCVVGAWRGRGGGGGGGGGESRLR